MKKVKTKLYERKYELNAYFLTMQRISFENQTFKLKNEIESARITNSVINDFNLYTIYMYTIKQHLHWIENRMHCHSSTKKIEMLEFKNAYAMFTKRQYSFVAMHSIEFTALFLILVFCIASPFYSLALYAITLIFLNFF